LFFLFTALRKGRIEKFQSVVGLTNGMQMDVLEVMVRYIYLFLEKFTSSMRVSSPRVTNPLPYVYQPGRYYKLKSVKTGVRL